jgi:hypothetical protein
MRRWTLKSREDMLGSRCKVLQQLSYRIQLHEAMICQ